MRSVKFLVVTVAMMMAFVACEKEKSTVSLVLNRSSLYFSSWKDSPQTVSYVAENATTVMIGSYSEGLYASVDTASSTVMVSTIGTTDESVELPKEGYVVVNALNEDNESVSCYINVYVSEPEYLDVEGHRSNCYVVTSPNTVYSFDAMHRPDGEPLATTSVALLWQSNNSVVKNVIKVGDNATFYISSLKGDETRVEDTNAVIGAYNALGEVIWSWHLWIVNENPLETVDTYTYSDGTTREFMHQNLGAFTNSNGSHEIRQIHDSYGMYYQWGRKDPFPRPYFYDAAYAEDEGRADGAGNFIAERREARTSYSGTVSYVTKMPMVFITTDGSDGIGDWLVTADNTLWKDDEKSIYDPCPYGWRVPSAADMSVLKLAENDDRTPLDVARKQFGWRLMDDSGRKFFYSACGRRRYIDGKVENMNSKDYQYNPETGEPVKPEPWEGYYWTSTTTADGKAVSLYFDLTTTRTINNFEPAYSARKANGFQIRCVKERE